MKLFILDGKDSRFIDVRKDFINLFTTNKTYVFDYQITQPRLVRWIATKQLPILPEYKPIWYQLYDYMGKPYKDLELWLSQLEALANQLDTREIAKYDDLSGLGDELVS